MTLRVGIINGVGGTAYGQGKASYRLSQRLAAVGIQPYFNSHFSSCHVLHSHSPFHHSISAVRRHSSTPHIFTLHSDLIFIRPFRCHCQAFLP